MIGPAVPACRCLMCTRPCLTVYSVFYNQYDFAHASYHGIAGDLIYAADGLRRRTSDQNTFSHGFQYETPSCHARMPANSDIPWRQTPAHSLHAPELTETCTLICVACIYQTSNLMCMCLPIVYITWRHRSIQDCALDEMRLNFKAVLTKVVCPEDVQTACHVVYSRWAEHTLDTSL